MMSRPMQLMRAVTACTLALMFALPVGLAAQTHVVSPSELQKEVLATTQTRQKNLKTVEDFLTSPAAGKALDTAHMDPQQVRTAVSTLNDSELAQIASQAEKVQHDFAAGALSERDLLIIILGIAALVLIIVAVR